MKVKYELQKKDKQTKGRYGILHTNYGSYETPMFMPVGTLANIKTMTIEQAKAEQDSFAYQTPSGKVEGVITKVYSIKTKRRAK